MGLLTAFASTTALVLFAAAGASAQEKPDFSGTWTLDPASVGGLSGPGGPPRQLTVTQDTGTIAISWAEGGTTTTMTYHLDGSESRNQEPGEPPVVSRVRWEDGRLVIATPDQMGGKTIEQHNVLSLDGDDLVVETEQINLGGGQPTVIRLVYEKAG